jgi:hypothetical protein
MTGQQKPEQAAKLYDDAVRKIVGDKNTVDAK